MRDRSLYEVLADICPRADTKTPGELAAMLKPWLCNLDERTSYPDSAPLMLRMLADAPGWNRFNYNDPLMRWVSGAHYLLKAAEHLNELEDVEPCLSLIGRAKEILEGAYRQLQIDKSGGPN